MVVIRLSRGGVRKRPFYHIVVADKQRSRDGRFIESIGYFNPIAAGKEVRLTINMERVQHWIVNGAQASDRVKYLIKTYHKKTSEQAQKVAEAES
ncbi:MAG TPA: 30S ribosomal protein S16 [Gammaproteobacteria bacterium]|nr:30S ribosomal protein S16 [Gammaproteobacteria bacterium]